MALSSHPTSLDHFFANYQNPILATTFATQVCHWQFIKRTEPALTPSSGTVRTSAFPRPLRAGLGWAAVFIVLMTKATLAKKAVSDYSDPVIAQGLQRKQMGGAFQSRL